MRHPFPLSIVLFPFVVSSTNRTGYTPFSEAVLTPQNYDRLVSPYEYNRQLMHMYVSVPICILIEVDEGRQVVSYIAAVNITWYDPRLEFDPEKMGYQYTIVPSMLLWVPPLEAFNSVALTFLDRETPSTDVFVGSNGWAFMLIRGKFDTVCSCDLEGFPFDTQYCMMDFELGLYTSSVALLHPGNPTELLIGLPEWNIFTPTLNSTFYVTRENTSFSMAQATFKLVRNPQFYTFMLILPTIIITTSALGALLLPLGIKEGEKVNIGLAGLLGLTFMLSVIVVQVPRSSKLPLMAKWLLVEMFYCIVGLIWEIPLRMVSCWLTRRFSERKGTERIPFVLGIGSAILFVGSNVLMTIIVFNNPPQPNHPGDKIL